MIAHTETRVYSLYYANFIRATLFSSNLFKKFLILGTLIFSVINEKLN